MMCWNVCRWSNLSIGELQLGEKCGENNARALVLKQYQPEFVGVIESKNCNGRTISCLKIVSGGSTGVRWDRRRKCYLG